uniref:ParB/RepB/Spo0J family partition protein n=1 Tax=candidate division WOR-3 bacterium TaxID=2052148 RepID=A0A7V3KMV4_UNCW3
MEQNQFQMISMDLIDRPIKIARELIDPEKVRELAESIREIGLLQPVILRPSNGRYEMVAGDRRYLAHKMLNLKEIKAVVMDLDDHETVVIRGIENLQRENLTPSEEAKFYQLLYEEGGLSASQIAKKTGRALSTITRYLRFAECPEEVRKAVDNKEISLLVLETLMEIDDPDIFNYHFKMAVANGINNTTARIWVDDYLKTKAGTYYSEGEGVHQSNIEIETRPSFMTCDVCLGPVEIKVIKNLMVCPECRKKVKGSNVKTS